MLVVGVVLFPPIGRLACPGAPFNVREADAWRVALYFVRGSSLLFVTAPTGRHEKSYGNALGAVEPAFTRFEGAWL